MIEGLADKIPAPIDHMAKGFLGKALKPLPVGLAVAIYRGLRK